MSEHDDIKKLRAIISDEIAKHDEDEKVDPEKVAAAVMEELDALLIQVAANLEIRQLSRDMLRHRCETSADRDKKRHKREPFLPGFKLIQRRYPAADGSGYLKTEKLSDTDIDFNVAQMRSRSGALSDHADELERYKSHPSRRARPDVVG